MADFATEEFRELIKVRRILGIDEVKLKFLDNQNKKNNILLKR